MKMQNTEIESTLQPINENLAHMVYSSSMRFHSEKDILHIMKLMASIRTHALEKGWDQKCDDDLISIQTILKHLQMTQGTI